MPISRVSEITGLFSPTTSSTTSTSFSSALRNQFLNQQASLIVNRQNSTTRVFTYLGALTRSFALDRSARNILSFNTQDSPLFKRSVASSDSSAVTATASDLSSIRTFGITVSQVATAQSVRSDVLADGDAHGLGSGTEEFRLTIQGTNFDFSIDLSSVTSNLDLLNEIADEVNSATNSGVFAEVTSDSSTGESFVSLVSHSTGTDEAFTLSDQSGTLLADLNLDETQAVDTTAGTGGLLVSAQDAIFALDNGSEQTSQRNTIDLFNDSVEVTLLTSTNEEAVILRVEPEESSIATALEDFVNSYNDSLQFALDNPSEVTSEMALRLILAVSPFVIQLEQLGIDRDPDTLLLSIDEDRLEEVIADTRFERLTSALTGPAGLATVALSVTNDVIKSSGRYLTNPDTGIEQFAIAKVERYQYIGRILDVLI